NMPKKQKKVVQIQENNLASKSNKMEAEGLERDDPRTVVDETNKMINFKESLRSQLCTVIASGYYPTCEDMYNAPLQAEKDFLMLEKKFKQNRSRLVFS
ncbi:hypothetical protein ACH5RR_003318, partial [Cinchona calisaya]